MEERMKKRLFYKILLSMMVVSLVAVGCNKTPKPEQRNTDTTVVSAETHKTENLVAIEIFKVRATVTKIDRRSGKITLEHQKIPGFMDTMSMTTALADSAIFDHIHEGSIGMFTLRVNNKIPEVTNVEPFSGKKSDSPEQSGRTYRVLAKVTAINKAEGTITIDHEKMEGFMDAMEMPYKVSDPSLIAKVAVGTEGHFTIRVVNEEGTIISIHVHNK
jgi:Cu/Ag efflux protein CusF